jgi:choline dehydrogenase
LNTYFVRPQSRGSVRLRSADPRDPPLVDINAFAEPVDLARTVDGIRLCREIMSQKAFEPFVAREHIPGPATRSQADFEAFARAAARSAYHPVGTCRMGTGAEAVLDPQLRVRGLDGLRVCDSSIMPRLISSNTNAASIMVGEKASDLIRGNRIAVIGGAPQEAPA